MPSNKHAAFAGPLTLQSAGEPFAVDEHKIEAVYDQSSSGAGGGRAHKGAFAFAEPTAAREIATREVWKLLGSLAHPLAVAGILKRGARSRPAAGRQGRAAADRADEERSENEGMPEHSRKADDAGAWEREREQRHTRQPGSAAASAAPQR